MPSRDRHWSAALLLNFTFETTLNFYTLQIAKKSKKIRKRTSTKILQKQKWEVTSLLQAKHNSTKIFNQELIQIGLLSNPKIPFSLIAESLELSSSAYNNIEYSITVFQQCLPKSVSPCSLNMQVLCILSFEPFCKGQLFSS